MSQCLLYGSERFSQWTYENLCHSCNLPRWWKKKCSRMNYHAIAYRFFLARGFSIVYLEADLECENNAGFYPHSSQMKNTPLICIYTTQFSQNMLCCVISIFVSVQCVFFLWAFFNSFHHIPPTFQELLRKSLNTLSNFFLFFCHLKSSMSLNPNNLLSLSLIFLENEKHCHTCTF